MSTPEQQQPQPKYTKLEKMIRDYLAADIDTFRLMGPYVTPNRNVQWTRGFGEGYQHGLIAAAKFIRQDYSND